MNRLKTITEYQAQLHKTTDAFTLLQDADVLDAFTPGVSFELGSRNRCPIVHLHSTSYTHEDVDLTYDVQKEKYVLFLYIDGKSFSCEPSSEYDVLRILRAIENRRPDEKPQGIWTRICNTKNYPQ